MKNTILTFLVFCLITNLSNSQEVLILQPNARMGQDAILHGLDSQVDVNWGNTPQFNINSWTYQGTPGTVRSIIHFDYSEIPEDAIIISAYLSLYSWGAENGFGPHSTLSGSNECFLHQITSDWDEQEVTWNTQPSYTEMGKVYIPASIDPYQDYNRIEVTNILKNQLNSNNFGFLIKLKEESHYRMMSFCSSDHENSRKHPQLIIQYKVVNPVTDTCLVFQPGPREGKDAILHGLSSEVNTNYGENHQVAANAWTYGGEPGIVRNLIEFDLQDINSSLKVEKAILSLYAWDNDQKEFGQHSTLSGSNQCILHRVTTPWEEDKVTWSSHPEYTFENQTIIPSSDFPIQNYPEIDVTLLVKDMIKNPNNSFGFLLKLNTEEYYRMMNFCSSDHSDPELRPQLKVFCRFHEEVNDPEVNDIDKPEEANIFNLYPNPTKNQLFIGAPENLNYTIKAYQLNGVLIQEYSISGSITELKISNYSPGIYIFSFITNDVINYQKVIIE